MKNDTHLPEKLFDLLQSHDWHQLSEPDLVEMKKWVTEEEYASLRRTYGMVKAAHQEEAATLRPETRAAVMAQFRQKHRKPTIALLGSARMPAWQAIAASLLMFAIGWALKPEKTTVQTIVEQVVRTDTVFMPAAVNTIESTLALAPQESKVSYPRPLKEPSKDAAAPAQPQPAKTRPFLVAELVDFNVLKLNDSTPFIKGKSFSEDTLSATFRFVQM